MRARALLSGLGIAAVAVAGVAVLAGAGGKTGDKTVTLDHIKRLAGDWVEVDEHGNLTDKLVESFRITAGGTAVLSTEFPGSEHEMITVYHQDGDDLLLTHYCMLGNQPHMKAAPESTPDRIVFKCTGKGTNMSSESDKHMHQGTFTFLSEDRISSVWLMHDQSEVVYKAEFEIARKPAE
jgi:hypothetical protein